jgi:S1-C subfamily serine protease
MLTRLSNDLADAVSAAAPAVVQVQGRRRPASGVIHGDGVIVTTARALGREDRLKVRGPGGEVFDAELAGWDPTTGLAVLRAAGLKQPVLPAGDANARTGQIGIALARSWSNAITASAGLVAVIGGPLATGRRRSIEQVIRTTAPMHDGFAGGAFIGPDGRLLGIITAAEIRGYRVVIPAKIAAASVASVLEHGRSTRVYIGIAGHPVQLSGNQRQADRESALLVVGVTPDSPAAAGGILVGDVILDVDGKPVSAPEDLLDLLFGHPAGRPVALRILRGTTIVTVSVTPTERPAA